MAIQDYYNKKEYKITRFRKQAILGFIKLENPLILDIGCASGILGSILKKEKNSIVHGVDISGEAIFEARRKLDQVYEFDISREGWPEEILKNKYDYIIVSEVLEHLFEPEKLLQKIKKISHKKTEIIITVPNILFWKNRLKIFFGNFNYTNEGIMDKGHIHFFSWKSFKKNMWQAGFEIIEEKHHIPTRGTSWPGCIFPGLFAFQFIIKARKKRKVIYTAIFGGKDKLIEPEFIPKDFDFFCFTDSNLKSDVWQIKKVKKFMEDPVRCARKIKILPHRYLPEYDISIWVDGNMQVRGDINQIIKNYLDKNDLAIYDHKKLVDDSRDCIYEEADVLTQMAEKGGKKYKDDPEIIKKQVKRYRNEGYPEHNGLISSMVIARRHNSSEVIKLMEFWWSELKQNSRRDQLSFDYAVWKKKTKYIYIEGDSRKNKYFLRLPHQRKENYK